MGVEIERKFLVVENWLPPTPGTPFLQGYLASGSSGATVRVRVAGDVAFITIKGPSSHGARAEFEYQIPVEDGREMLSTLAAGVVIEKSRHLVDHKGHTWEVDVFHGANEGLVVAEVELESIGEEVSLPDWIAAEVTEDRRYANSYLSAHPFSEWRDEGVRP